MGVHTGAFRRCAQSVRCERTFTCWQSCHATGNFIWAYSLWEWPSNATSIRYRRWVLYLCYTHCTINIGLRFGPPGSGWPCQRYRWFLPARRYAIAGTSYGPVSVIQSRCFIETVVERVWVVLGTGAVYKEIQVSSKIGPKGTSL